MSVVNFSYDLENGEYVIDLRMFLDDFMAVMTGQDETNFQGNSLLLVPSKKEVKDYLTENFQLVINDMPVDLQVRKVEIEELTIYVTFKSPDLIPPSEIKKALVRNSIFVDRFVNQRNVIHFNLPERSRKSILFNSHKREGEIQFK